MAWGSALLDISSTNEDISYDFQLNISAVLVKGEDGWLFYKNGVEYLTRPYMGDPRSMVVDPNDIPLIDDPIKAIVTFRNQLKERGIDLMVVIVPGKPSIYPEKLNPITKSETGSIGTF